MKTASSEHACCTEVRLIVPVTCGTVTRDSDRAAAARDGRPLVKKDLDAVRIGRTASDGSDGLWNEVADRQVEVKAWVLPFVVTFDVPDGRTFLSTDR